MKGEMTIFLYILLALLSGPHCYDSASDLQLSSNSADIEFTYLRSWYMNGGYYVYGGDILEYNGKTYFTYPIMNTSVGKLDLATGSETILGAVPSGTSMHGIAFANDSQDTPTCVLYSGNHFVYSDDLLATWTTVPILVGLGGGEMGYDGSHFWACNGSDSLYRFQLDGSFQAIPIPG